MRLLTLVATAVSLCTASVSQIDLAVKGQLIERQSNLCGVKGTRILPTIFGSSQKSLTVPAQCGALCKSNSLCKSFAVDANTCYLYLAALTKYIKQDPNGPFTYYDIGCVTATDLCWVTGKPKPSTAVLKSSTYFRDNSWTGCSDLCKKTAGCKSYTLGTGSCNLYSNTVAKNLLVDQQSTQAFWDVNCVLSAAALPPPPAGPSHDISQANEVSVQPDPPSFTSPPAFTPFVTTSPPLSSMVQPKFGGFEDDNDFTDSYNYTQYPLPTPTALGSAPATTGFLIQASEAPSAPCLVSSGPQAQVTILNEDYLPLVSKASNQLGPVAQPTKEPAASDILSQHPEKMAFPLFYFQAPAGAPTDTFDLIYAPTSQYVALQDNGNVVLRSASSGSSFAGGFATTIFKMNCFGVLSVSQGGSTWVWSTNGATTKMVKGTSTKNFNILPHNNPGIVAAKKSRKRSLELAKQLEARGKDQEGRAPRCPNKAGFPPDLVAHYKQGYEFGEGNLCDNLSEFWGLSPFSFDKSCATQSLCYDLCEKFGWETCNGIFSGLMFASCAPYFKSWWDAIAGLGCVAQAGYFTGVAATNKGREVFYKSQEAMCSCFCRDGLSQCGTSKMSSGFDCVDLKAADDFNCGLCGRSCAPKSECKGNGNCGCIGQQCDNICLDLRNNPDNCGQCGRKCDPRYCVAGSCYKPDPAGCTPDPPIRDEDISPFSQWSYNESIIAPCVQSNSVNIGTATLTIPGDSTVYNVASFVYTDMPSGIGCSGTIMQKKVKICPEFKYELKFNAIYLRDFQQNGTPLLTNAACKVTWGLGRPDGTDFGQFASQSFNVVDNRLKQYGPFSFNIVKSGPGVTKVKGDYFIDLWAVISCGGGIAGAIAVNGVEVNQVGLV